MSYIYSQSDRLIEPHSYMYTPFEGEGLLREYHTSRLEAIKRLLAKDVARESQASILFLTRAFETHSTVAAQRFKQLLSLDAAPECTPLSNECSALMSFSIDNPIKTRELLQTLVHAQLVDTPVIEVRVWLNRLLQKFEVTKKIYETYPTGFGKGEGENGNIELYELFGLVLAQHYARHRELKYLSTLLKLCDLLCSILERLRQDALSSRIMAAVLATELVSVEMLMTEKGLQCI